MLCSHLSPLARSCLSPAVGRLRPFEWRSSVQRCPWRSYHQPEVNTYIKDKYKNIFNYQFSYVLCDHIVDLNLILIYKYND